jgi:hypothetical protein
MPAQVVHDDARTPPGQLKRVAATHATPGARDHDHVTVELKCCHPPHPSLWHSVPAGSTVTHVTASAATPLQAANLFHTGVVVDDLDAAKDELGRALAVSWRDGGGRVQLVTDEGTRVVRTSYALSREGPHHIELCQSIPGTLWTAAAPGQAHHLGYWVADVASASAQLQELGSTKIATVTVGDDAPPICAYHRTQNGLYVELVALAMRSVLTPED